MTKLAFLDTNVLLYADDVDSPDKQRIAIDLVTELSAHDALVLSLQVLQEYFAAATRKLDVSAETAQRKVEWLAGRRVVRFEAADVIAAIELHRLNRISFWDAMIVHAARKAGAVVLYSEDLSHGSTLGGVRIENPFAGLL